MYAEEKHTVEEELAGKYVTGWFISSSGMQQ